MNKQLLRQRLALMQGEEGVAIILVVSVGVIVMALLVTLMSYTVISVGHARREQDYQAALSAAQAGVDDYLSRLNANNVYWQNTPDCNNKAMQRPLPGASPTCGWVSGTAVGWVAIAGAQTPSGASCTTTTPTPPSCTVYHYDVDATGTIANGTISVTSTGKSKGITRSINVSVRRQSFGDFLYFTDYETVDPSNPFVYGVNNTYAQQQCTAHFWDGRNAGCTNINFITGDTINGPLHSNDAILVSGSPTFNGPVTTAYTACQGAKTASSCYRAGTSPSPTFAKGISYVNDLPMPASNTALQAQTAASTAYGSPGCQYTGPTRIHFNAPTGGATTGTMTVWSPYTKTVNAGCGTAPFTSASQTVNVPNNNVVYIAPVPSGQSSPASGNCPAKAIGNYPQAGDVSYSYGAYDCRAGTLFVDGALGGRLTLGAANIYVVDNLTYANGTGGADSLGLISSNSVEVYHPVQCTNTDNNGGCTAGTNMNRPDASGNATVAPFTNPVIQAAILSLQHSFDVEMYSLGSSLGTLNVYGSIGQLFRGSVGTTGGSSGTTGYLKSYVYDTRLKFAPPPYYLNPVQAKYISAVFAEVAPVY